MIILEFAFCVFVSILPNEDSQKKEF